MTIRDCTLNDGREVYSLLCELCEKTLDFASFEEAFAHKIGSEGCYCILGMEGVQTIGFLCMQIGYQLHHLGKVATVEELVISAQHRSHGAGKALLEEAIAHARAKHCDAIELTSNFHRERAHAFYLRNGFEKRSYKFTLLT